MDPRLYDKWYRMNTLYKIITKATELSVFVPNRAQHHFHFHKHKKNIILKSRRLGFTTYNAIDMLDDTLFNPHFESLIKSYDDDSSAEVFNKMIMGAFMHLPQSIRDLYDIDTGNAKTLILDFRNKTFSSIKAKSSGRGGRYNKILVSEFAKMCAQGAGKADEVLTGTVPALTPDGTITFESTAEGETGDFHDMWWTAWNDPDMQGEDPSKYHPEKYKAFFYNWQWEDYEISLITQVDPTIPKEFKDYQAKHNEKALRYPNRYQLMDDKQLTFWYGKFLSLGGKSWQKLFENYPTTPEEAFAASGTKMFDMDQVQRQLDFVSRLPQPRLLGDWQIIKEPVLTHQYIIGADPSEGIGGDHSAAVVLDISTPKPEVVATYTSNQTPPDMFAFELKHKGEMYNMAYIMVERNNMGGTTLVKLRDVYPEHKIHKETREDYTDTKESERLGWLTTSLTKPRMFFRLKTMVEEDTIRLNSKFLCHEAKLYDKKSLHKVKADPEATNHFDLITSLAIATEGIPLINAYNTPVTTVSPNRKTNFNPFAGI